MNKFFFVFFFFFNATSYLSAVYSKTKYSSTQLMVVPLFLLRWNTRVSNGKVRMVAKTIDSFRLIFFFFFSVFISNVYWFKLFT